MYESEFERADAPIDLSYREYNEPYDNIVYNFISDRINEFEINTVIKLTSLEVYSGHKLIKPLILLSWRLLQAI